MSISLRDIFANLRKQKNRKFIWSGLCLLVLSIVIATAIPVFVIMPFKAQTPDGIFWSYHLRRWLPVATIVSILAAGFLIISLWRGTRWFGKAILILLLLPVIGVTWFVRQNHFEWMFNPLSNAAYADIKDTNFVSLTDMVIAIEINGEAVAYPIRQMAYHHIVQDTVGNVPITVTY